MTTSVGESRDEWPPIGECSLVGFASLVILDSARRKGFFWQLATREPTIRIAERIRYTATVERNRAAAL